MTILWLGLAGVLVFLGYVRMAPSDPGRWHDMPEITDDKTFENGVIRVVHTGPDGLKRLHDLALKTPRTTVLAGAVNNGMITFVTRTKMIGFPDYTTVRQSGDTLEIYARLRFGRSDFGVNKIRVETWIKALQS